MLMCVFSMCELNCVTTYLRTIPKTHGYLGLTWSRWGAWPSC